MTQLTLIARARRQSVPVSRCVTQVTGTARPIVALRVESENAPAMRLHKSFGFRVRAD